MITSANRSRLLSVYAPAAYSLTAVASTFLQGFGFISYNSMINYSVGISIIIYVVLLIRLKIRTKMDIFALLYMFFVVNLYSEFGTYYVVRIDYELNKQNYLDMTKKSDKHVILVKTFDYLGSGPYASTSITELQFYQEPSDLKVFAPVGLCKSKLINIAPHFVYVDTVC